MHENKKATPQTFTTPRVKAYRDLPIYSLAEWENVQHLRRALREHETGIFHQPAQVVDAMGRDDRIMGCIDQRFLGLLGLPFEMDTQENAKRDAAAKELKELWPRMFPEHELLELAKWGFFLGVGFGQLIWKQTEGRWLPTLKTWNPRFTYWRWDTRSYWTATENEGLVEILPGSGQWIVFTPFGVQRGWMSGLVRSLAIPWIIRQWDWRDWARHNEVHGLPIKKGYVPASAQEEDKKRFIDELAGLGSESVIRLPQGPEGEHDSFDVELLEAVADTSQTFERLLDKTDMAITVRILGQNLTTEVKGGSHAAATVHQNVRGDILRFTGESLSTCLRDQALQAYCAFNLGDPDLAPYPKWDVQPPEDNVQKGQALKNYGDGISALQGTGAKPDVDQILEDAGIPTKGPAGDPPKPEPEVVAAPPPGKGKPPGKKPAKAAQLNLLEGGPRASGFVQGQVYADELVDASAQEAERAMRPDLETLLTIVKSANDYEQLREALKKHYAGMDPAKLAKLVEKTLILAELNGMHAVLEDL